MATIASQLTIEASVVCAVDGNKVGSVFFESLTLREVLSKPDSSVAS